MLVKNININLIPFHESKPADNKDGLDFLLLFGGWQWRLAKWGSEKQMFYTESGDYIESNIFDWAELPN